MSERIAVAGGRARGFSLLEVLVAFSILGLALGILMQIFSSSTRNVAVGSDYTKALLLGESKLAAAGTVLALTESVQEGSESGFGWRLVSVPVDYGLGPAPLAAFQVTVTVDWVSAGQGRSVSLDTLKLAPAR